MRLRRGTRRFRSDTTTCGFASDAESRDSVTVDWKMVSRIFLSWNRLDGWLRLVDGLRRAA